MLRNHGASQYERRKGQPYQHRLARVVHLVAYARVKRIVHMSDAFTAAQMELRGMPGALACLSATGQDEGTKLTDEGMAHLLRDIGGIDPRAPPQGWTARSHRTWTARPTTPSTLDTAWSAAPTATSRARTRPPPGCWPRCAFSAA